MTPGPTPRRVPIPRPLPGELTTDQLHALYGRLDILRDDLSGLLEDGYLTTLRIALDVELARLYDVIWRPWADNECQPGHHRPNCGFAAPATGERITPSLGRHPVSGRPVEYTGCGPTASYLEAHPGLASGD